MRFLMSAVFIIVFMIVHAGDGGGENPLNSDDSVAATEQSGAVPTEDDDTQAEGSRNTRFELAVQSGLEGYRRNPYG